MKKALILATNHKSIFVKSLEKNLSREGIQYSILNPSKLFLMLSSNEVGRNKVFDDLTNTTLRKVDLNDFDIVIPRIGADVSFACEVLKYLEEVFGLMSLQSSEAISNAYSKIRTGTLLRANGIRTPKTIFVNNIKHADAVLQKLSKDQKYVIKLDKGSQGKQVSIVTGIAEAKSVLDTIGSMHKQIIIQDYIENTGSDIRVIVMAGVVIGAYERKAGKQELRNNISTGGEGVKINLTKDEELFCINAARAVGLNFSGVDLMRGKDGKLYCIEVNHCPGMKVQQFIETDIALALVDYCKDLTEFKPKKRYTAAEIEELISIKSHTFDSDEFKKIFARVKGKTIRTNGGGHLIIKHKHDLQELMLSQFKKVI